MSAEAEPAEQGWHDDGAPWRKSERPGHLPKDAPHPGLSQQIHALGSGLSTWGSEEGGQG